MIGALLRPRDVDAWYALALKSRANRNGAALFCYGEALKNDPNAYAFGDGRGLSNRWAQAELYLEIREPKRALEHLVALYAREPADARVATRLARVHAELGDFETAEKTLDVFVANTPNAADLTLINVHAESKMHAHAFAEAAALIGDARRRRAERARARERDRVAAAESARLEASERALVMGESSVRAEALGHAAAAEAHNAALEAQKLEPPFPPDLVAKAAMCLLYLNDARARARAPRRVARDGPARMARPVVRVRRGVPGRARVRARRGALHEAHTRGPGCVRRARDVGARRRVRQGARVGELSETPRSPPPPRKPPRWSFWRSVARRHPEDVDATLPLAEALLAKGAPLGEVLDALPDERALLRAMTAAQSGSVGKNAAEVVENDDDARGGGGARSVPRRARSRAAPARRRRRRVPAPRRTAHRLETRARCRGRRRRAQTQTSDARRGGGGAQKTREA